MRWIVLLLTTAGIYYLSQNWASLTSQWHVEISRLFSMPQGASQSPENGTGNPASTWPEANRGTATTNLAHAAPMAEMWGQRTVGGLAVNLPFSLQPYNLGNPGSLPPNVRVEGFKGESGGRKIFLSHGTNTTLVGGVMLSWTDRPLGIAAEKLNMDFISKNPATLINGLRVRRSDYISHDGNPRTRVRFAVLERANQAWGIEIHAPESDAGAEAWFQRITQSAR